MHSMSSAAQTNLCRGSAPAFSSSLHLAKFSFLTSLQHFQSPLLNLDDICTFLSFCFSISFSLLNLNIFILHQSLSFLQQWLDALLQPSTDTSSMYVRICTLQLVAEPTCRIASWWSNRACVRLGLSPWREKSLRGLNTRSRGSIPRWKQAWIDLGLVGMSFLPMAVGSEAPEQTGLCHLDL